MSDQSNVTALARAHLAKAASSFSIGSFGAIGEFHRDPDEALDIDDPGRLTLATPRGAIRMMLRPEAQPIAYEQLSGRPRRWQQGVAFCLPRALARSSGRTVLTEVGPDLEAIREDNRGDILFDLGLRAENMEFCVRSRDPDLLAVLRAEEGRDLLAGPSAAMEAIKDHGPHRVARSALGRIEVYQAISRTKTPEGPHTHVLPKLIARGRTHSANTPVPDGSLPCLSLYPANPLNDALGEPKPFAADEFDAFQSILARWGPAEYLEAKGRVARALAAGERPEVFKAPPSRLGRAAVRIALRQRTWTHGGDDLIRAWCEAFDGATASDDDLDQD